MPFNHNPQEIVKPPNGGVNKKARERAGQVTLAKKSSGGAPTPAEDSIPGLDGRDTIDRGDTVIELGGVVVGGAGTIFVEGVAGLDEFDFDLT
jgi:hypothetical protein